MICYTERGKLSDIVFLSFHLFITNSISILHQLYIFLSCSRISSYFFIGFIQCSWVWFFWNSAPLVIIFKTYISVLLIPFNMFIYWILFHLKKQTNLQKSSLALSSSRHRISPFIYPHITQKKRIQLSYYYRLLRCIPPGFRSSTLIWSSTVSLYLEWSF